MRLEHVGIIHECYNKFAVELQNYIPTNANGVERSPTHDRWISSSEREEEKKCADVQVRVGGGAGQDAQVTRLVADGYWPARHGTAPLNVRGARLQRWAAPLPQRPSHT